MKNPSASLLDRLKNASRKTNVPMPMTLRKYAYDRLLDLMVRNGTADNFCLKGGVLLGVLFDGNVYRPTNDLDFNGLDRGLRIDHLHQIVGDTCSAHDGADGLTFDVSAIRVLKDRDEIVPGGKLAFDARIGSTKIPLRIDVGYGNVVTPQNRQVLINTVLPDLIAPIPFQAYPLETIISEKIHAMSRHGAQNTRIKDYFDVYVMSETFEIDGEELAAAIANTFDQHGDDVPEKFSALSERFAQSRSNAGQWDLFLKEAHADIRTPFEDVVAHLRGFVEDAAAMAVGAIPTLDWSPYVGWYSYEPKQEVEPSEDVDGPTLS
ncbi:nucleotidyl transferase AbiEii/AbiGii toxin family protein [Rhizobium leguminosarum]|uniref:nucleotidyl transferase AbiEii/AbiGii toxin family protein n=1 Tax=Rhizobium leguminosarum TaxID=384 RepID=UPI002E11C086|nr:nucleotidyl transferase AbiEii/AbiGii toxin family protein [Rhizobium leguminosarum]